MNNYPSQQPFCKVGDTVEFIREVTTGNDENVKIGDKYTVVALIGWGWDLKKISGEGAIFLRILNSKMKDYVIVYKQS